MSCIQRASDTVVNDDLGVFGIAGVGERYGKRAADDRPRPDTPGSGGVFQRQVGLKRSRRMAGDQRGNGNVVHVNRQIDALVIRQDHVPVG